jgi:flagellar export protein FliJ
MPAFEFRLTSLWSLRRAERDARRGELAAALDAQREAVAERRAVEERLQRHFEETRGGAVRGPVDLQRLRTAGTYEAALRGQLASLAERENAADAEVARRQDALAAAEGEVRVLEKLRERQHGRFRAEQARLETRHADDAAAHVRR